MLLENGAETRPYYTQVLDLTADEKALAADRRESYRSLINSGLRELEPRVIDRSNFDPHHIEEFRKLHIKAAKRETRSERSWEIQGEWVRSGHAFMVLGHLDQKLVSAALFMTTQKFAYYGVGAYDRELFEKPLSHAVVWKGILHCKELGCTRLEMGQAARGRPGDGEGSGHRRQSHQAEPQGAHQGAKGKAGNRPRRRRKKWSIRSQSLRTRRSEPKKLRAAQ